MAKWLKENNEDLGIKIILFFISPFFSLLYSLKRVNTKSSYLFFFLFAILFGLNFTTSNGRDEYNTGDAAVYRQSFELYKYSNIDDLKNYYKETMSMENERRRDVYVISMIYIASLFSLDYHIFFMLLAIVFSYFMLRSMKFLTEEDSFNYTSMYVLILCIFVFNNGIFNINGCRFWTASWIAIYSIFQIFRNNNVRYLLLIALTPLIHQAYWFLVVILLIVLLTRFFNNIWKILFFASFFVSSFAIEFVTDISEYLPTSLQFLIERYTTEEAISSLYRSNYYQVIRRIFKLIFNIYISYIILLFIRDEKNLLSNSKTKNIYRFLLIYMTIINFFAMIPSLGTRFQIIALPFIAYLWLVNFESRRKHRVVILIFPLISMFFFYERIMAYLFHSVPISFYFISPIAQIINFLTQ